MSYCLNPKCSHPENPDDFHTQNFCIYCGTKLRLRERYRAIKLIGQGGFGRTFLAIDEDKPSKPSCVIKQFFPQSQGTENNEKATQLFEQEAVRLDDLGKHPQIPELYAHFTQDDRQYLIQQFIEGKNLSEMLLHQENFNDAQIKQLLNRLLPVLDFIHKNNIIHRDIKPDNIIMTPENELVLVDFGAAKYVNTNKINYTGTTIGTPEFVAPEQSRGKAIFASDLYSLGVTCIYLMTNISPFDLFDINEDMWIWKDYLVDNPVSKQVADILDKLIENAPKKRYQNAEEVLIDLNKESSAITPVKIDTKAANWLTNLNNVYQNLRQEITLEWKEFSLTGYTGYLELNSSAKVVDEYIKNHHYWFPRCADPLKVVAIGQNGYDILVGKYGALKFEIEVRLGLELLPPNSQGIYKINSINLPNYTPPGYGIDFKGSFKLTEIPLQKKNFLSMLGFNREQSVMTRWDYQLDLQVKIKFPKFILRLPESVIKNTGDRIILQVVNEVSRRLSERVKNEFHLSLGKK